MKTLNNISNKNMKTSQKQFEMMLTFMEHHGDLSNTPKSAKARIYQLKLWEELTELLNSEASGCKKSSDKWKKVWSDYKSNTKKKAARLNRSARSSGGGAAVLNKLTDLQCRIIEITGIGAVEGSLVEEAGHKQIDGPSERQTEPELTSSTPHPHESLVSDIEFMDDYYEVLGPYSKQPEDDDADDGDTQQEERGRCRRRSPPLIIGSGSPAAARPVQPDLAGQTPRRRAACGRGWTSRRVHRRSTSQIDQAIINANTEWRQLQMQQNERDLEIRREANRVKLMEIETHKVWQEIGSRALNIIEKVIDKYLKD